MKKKYTTILLLIISISLFGQFATLEVDGNESSLTHDNILINQNLNQSTASNAMAASPIWEEDFSGGFPQGWSTYTNNTQGGVSTCPWVWTLDGTWGYWNANNGTSPNYTLASTTASNGFLISDTDSANHYAYGQPSGSTYQYIESSFTTSAIDLSMYPAVSLEFEQIFRYNNLGNQNFTPPTLYVSSDSVNWTPFLVNGSTGSNTQSANPDKMIINITPVAGGQSTVYLKFGWVSRCYFWMIDDLRIIETPRNLIEIEDVVIGGFWIDYASYTGAGLNTIVGLDYSITPASQLANHPYVIEGVLRNRGSEDQTSMLKYEVYGASSYSGSSAPTSVLAYSASNSVDSVIVATSPSLSPPIGQYGVSIWGESDSAGIQTAITDTVYKTFEISDYIYGKDLGSSTPGAYILGGAVDQNHIITRYEMYANEQLYSIRAFISDQSDVGAEIKAIIYEWDSTATGGRSFYDESDNYVITAQDLGSWVDIPFVTPVTLLTGYAYSCGVVGYQHPTDSSFIGTSGKSMYNGEHSLFDELGLSTQSNGTPTWYYITSTPMIRMNFDPSSGSLQSFDCDNQGNCSDPGTGLGQYTSLAACQAACISSAVNDIESNVAIYPNPSNGIFVIELDALGKYDVTIYNVLGQTVLSTFTNSMTTSIDLSSFDKGIYTVELKDKNTIYTDKVIVE